MEQHTVTWIDSGREPQCESNPKYPDGIDLDLSDGANTVCRILLAYPAKRCGMYLISCNLCGQSVIVTTAGRRDDPRMVTLACRLRRPVTVGGPDGDVDEGRRETVFHGAG